MAIDTDKILRMNETEFRNNLSETGSLRREYEVRGVNYAQMMDKDDDPVEKFAEQVPNNAEWVINFRQEPGGANEFDRYAYCASGLALIPKKK